MIIAMNKIVFFKKRVVEMKTHLQLKTLKKVIMKKRKRKKRRKNPKLAVNTLLEEKKLTMLSWTV